MRFFLLFVFILFLIIGCTNPKEEIVERQKQLKDSIDNAKTRLKDFNDILYKGERYQRISQDDFNKEISRIEDEETRLSSFVKEYDSLEFELKKY
jgi:CRISPR/Cas system-associated protein Cas5 (RAMP superfamily)